MLSAITSVASLAVGIVANGGVGFLAAGIVWYWLPRLNGERGPRFPGAGARVSDTAASGTAR
jgi:hypothetical protein